jgi:hypothetical protein
VAEVADKQKLRNFARCAYVSRSAASDWLHVAERLIYEITCNHMCESGDRTTVRPATIDSGERRSPCIYRRRVMEAKEDSETHAHAAVGPPTAHERFDDRATLNCGGAVAGWLHIREDGHQDSAYCSRWDTLKEQLCFSPQTCRIRKGSIEAEVRLFTCRPER